MSRQLNGKSERENWVKVLGLWGVTTIERA